MSDTAPEGTQAPQQAEGPQMDVGPVLDRITDLGNQFAEFRDSFQQPPDTYQDPYAPQEPGFQYGQPQQDYGQYQQPQGQPALDQFGNPVYGQDPYQTQPDQGTQMLQQLISGAVQQAVAPIHQQFEQQQRAQAEAAWESEITQLETEFPEITDEKVAERVADQAFNLAGEIAQQMLPSLTPQQQQAIRASGVDLGKLIAAQPGFIRNTYLASKAQLEAEQETPAAASQGSQLERGGGAAQPADQPDPASQWLGGDRPRRTLTELGI